MYMHVSGKRTSSKRDREPAERDESAERDRRRGSSPRDESPERDRREREKGRGSREDREPEVGGGFRRTSQGRDIARLQHLENDEHANASDSGGSEHEAPSDLPTLSSTYVASSDLPRPKPPHKYKPKWFTSKEDKERIRAAMEQQRASAKANSSPIEDRDRERRGTVPLANLTARVLSSFQLCDVS